MQRCSVCRKRSIIHSLLPETLVSVAFSRSDKGNLTGTFFFLCWSRNTLAVSMQKQNKLNDDDTIMKETQAGCGTVIWNTPSLPRSCLCVCLSLSVAETNSRRTNQSSGVLVSANSIKPAHHTLPACLPAYLGAPLHKHSNSLLLPRPPPNPLPPIQHI